MLREFREIEEAAEISAFVKLVLVSVNASPRYSAPGRVKSYGE